ncbi:hypothetical protein ACN27G_25200 [Plantactinospora sp. WMMB334]|uniref:hypothetical protein n=1 Tax=Plantactinospora sp. WMMB334 TaxID=3404119 RepID=UPI003B945005
MFDAAPQPPEPPRLTAEQQIERLTKQTQSQERVLLDLHRRLCDARARLALISRIARDQDRCRRTPESSWAAVRAALHARPDNLRLVPRNLPARW